MIWQPEFTDKTLSRKPGAVHMYTQKALWYRHNGDREGMRVCLNLSRVEVLNQRYSLGPCPF
ncbi:hypothetical protein FEU54_21675 [Escherichia coli]|nr:hypothetical protein [Escherichia coli]EFH5518690.1 hypothetical protein [Escherichia coli]